MAKRVTRVFVANRGEIAVRIIRACREAGIDTVLAVSEADRETLGAQLADGVVCIGPPPASKSYLRPDVLVHAAVATGCDALHPGYGFLSEQPALAETCEEHGVAFIGPEAASLRLFGDKISAREAAQRAGVPIVPGAPVLDPDQARELASQVGYPLLVKASHGGGGRGIKVVHASGELPQTLELAAAEAAASFGKSDLHLERYVERAKHVEVQVIGDGRGAVVHLGERECSIQFRYQKLIEEAPCALLPRRLREELCEAAVALLAAERYRGAGTVEFLVDLDRDEFYFLEVNARIQVEHPVTEAVTGVDIVRTQLALAAGEALPFDQASIRSEGHAIECRITAQAPAEGMRPSPGRLEVWHVPAGEGIRVDTHCFPGYVVPPQYDALLAKLIVHDRDRASAVASMRGALAGLRVAGVETTAELQRQILKHGDFAAGACDTKWLERLLQNGTLAAETAERVPAG
jgi:acetyl-CoA carboxylase, biotin carboxylase subunit